jgi:hypothetical protein
MPDENPKIINNQNRKEIQDSYVEYLVAGMDLDTLFEIARTHLQIDKDTYSHEELEYEIEEYYKIEDFYEVNQEESDEQLDIARKVMEQDSETLKKLADN